MAGAEDGIVAKVDQARTLLALASTAGEAKKVADIAHAAAVYAKRQKLSQEAIDYATSIKLDAMTLMGEMLKAAEKNTGAKGQLGPGPGRGHKGENGSSKSEPPFSDAPAPPTLTDLGISKKESSNAQVLATAKEKAPDLHAKVKAGELTIPQVRVELKRQEKREDLKAKAEAAAAVDAEAGADLPPAWEVVTDDCVARLQRLAPGSVRLVFADPPYNIGFDYGEGHNDLLPDDQYLSWVRRWVGEGVRALAPDGSFWVLINDEWAAEFCLILKGAGLTVRNWVKWYESFGVNCADKFNRCSRHLFYCVKDPKAYVFHADAVSRPSDRQAKYNDARAAPGGKILDDVWTDIPRLVGTAAERLPDFPTQLPLALLRRVVGCSSDPGDLVVDPFSGSGTTGVACLELGRRYLGIERSETFSAQARLRLKGATARDTR